MSNSTERDDMPARAEQGAVIHPSEMDAAIEAKAARMHGLGRLRDKYFGASVMGDGAMSMMLSLLVGELQGRPVTSGALAVGGLLSREETDLMIDKLVSAGLAVVTEAGPDRRTVGLTPLGSARMRSFVNDYPDV